MEYAKAYAQSILTMKLRCWNQLPLKLCALAHHNPKVAQSSAQACLDLYQATPDEQMQYHHPLSVVFLDCCGRCYKYVEAMAKGVPITDLPKDFASLVASLQFIPIAERVIEAEHKNVKKTLAKLTRSKGARVSVAIRADEITSVCHDPASRGAFCHRLEITQSTKKLISNLGIGAHPSIDSCSPGSLFANAETVIYRCDLPAQYFDYSNATRFDESAKLQRKKDTAKLTPSRISWNDIMNHAILAYLRRGRPADSSSWQAAGKPFFSLQLPAAGPQPKWRSLDDVAKGSLETNIAPQLMNSSAPICNSCEGNEATSLSIVYFVPLQKEFSRTKQVPQTTATMGFKVTADSVFILQYECIFNDGSVAYVCNACAETDRETGVLVLSDLAALDLQRLQSGFLEWRALPSQFLFVRGIDSSTREKVERVSILLSGILQQTTQAANFAVENGQRFKLKAVSCLDVDILKELACVQCVEIFTATEPELAITIGVEVPDKTDVVCVLKSLFFKKLQFGACLVNPVATLSPPTSTPIVQLSTMHALQKLCHEGWQWSLQPRKKQLQLAPFVTKGPRIFYSAGVEVDLAYLQALLQAASLFERGTPCIPHGRSNSEYQKLLSGGTIENCESALKASQQQARAKTLQSDGFSLALPAARVEGAKARKLPLNESEARQGSGFPQRPRYFEPQVAAHCGLHAVNNLLGGLTGKKTFELNHMSDAITTLEEEFKRDGSAWVLQDHVSVSGDYSLQLLQWLLLRHSVERKEGYYFTSNNLTDLQHVAPQALEASDLAGGLVHIPSCNDKHHGHWVCFTKCSKSTTEKSYFWIDSTSGFQAITLSDLKYKLSSLQFVASLQTIRF